MNWDRCTWAESAVTLGGNRLSQRASSGWIQLTGGNLYFVVEDGQSMRNNTNFEIRKKHK